ncbi:hypothetical protein KP79_PYT10682 [Mizuhopecten yessoensis]|uniref:Uncharacterized protein n=1 Tax=Mizuhopecten yessoensis TaxID=6573 RepID=A0A210QYF3_MIZYE|nr:hypothetical protein KP79_PYT10682 [Mizuhopecten yessoensis]
MMKNGTILHMYTVLLTAPLEPGHVGNANQMRPRSPLNLEEELRQQQPKANVVQVPVNYIPPPPPPLLHQNDVISDEANTMLDNLSFEEIVEDVLSTLKKHPEILKELALDEEQKTGIQIDQNDENGNIPTDFQMPSPQLLEMPKRVEKKAGGLYLDNKRRSKPGSYWKQRYGGDKSSDESSDSESEQDSESSQSVSKPSSSSSSSSSSSEEASSQDESSEEYSNHIPQKRQKELPEATIDLLPLPEEGGSELNTGNKRFRESRTHKKNAGTYTAWAPPASLNIPQQLEHDAGNNKLILESPFMNSMPLFLPGDLKGNKPNELTPENQAEMMALAQLEAENESEGESEGEEEEEENVPIKDMEQLQSLENRERKKAEERAKKEKISSEVSKSQLDSEEGELVALAKDGSSKHRAGEKSM